jgi:hypothetical protein
MKETVFPAAACVAALAMSSGVLARTAQLREPGVVDVAGHDHHDGGRRCSRCHEHHGHQGQHDKDDADDD